MVLDQKSSEEMPASLAKPPLSENLHIINWAFFIFAVNICCLFIFDNFYSKENTEPRPGRDYIAFWSASYLANTGHASEAYDHHSINLIAKSIDPLVGDFGWFYPPTYQATIYPLAKVEYRLSFILFFILSLSVFTISIKLISQKRLGLVDALAFPATSVSLFFGQNSLLTAGILLLGLYNLKEKPVISGIFFGILTIKPHLALLLPVALAVGRYWTALISFIVTTLVIIAYSIILLDSTTWLIFFEKIDTPKNLLETGALPWRVMTSIFSNARILGLNVDASYLAHLIFSLVVIFALIYVWKKTTDLALRGSILVLATLGLSPYMYDYELTWLAIPLALLFSRGKNLGWLPMEVSILMLVWLTPLISFILRLTYPNLISIYLITETALLFLIIKKTNEDIRKSSKNNLAKDFEHR